MKTVIYLFVLVALVACQSRTNQNVNSDAQFFTENIASVEFSEPIVTDKNFFFSTMGGKMFIMTDCKTAQDMNNMFLQENNSTIADLGIANAFFLDGELCTARHATKGLESLCNNIGNDITMIDYATMLKSGNNCKIPLIVGYLRDTFALNDSVFVRGYYSDSKGVIKNVTVKGIGTSSDELMKQDYSGSQNLEFLEKNSVIMRLERNIDLGGLSGAPAFNKQGKVVGVYSGRSLMVSGSDTTCYIRVSLL